MVRWLFQKRPLQERMIAVGATILVLSLVGPILAGLVNPQVLDNSKRFMIPGSIGGLLFIGIGLILVARRRD